MTDERWGCPFEHLGLCGLNLETGKKMSYEDIVDSDAPCGFYNKLECDWRKKYAPHHAVVLRPGACTADAKTIREKIRAREKGIEGIKGEIAQKQEKINLMAHDPDRDISPPEETETKDPPDPQHALRPGVIGEIMIAFSAVAMAWFLISTVLFLGYIAFGICICMLSPEAAICAETIGGTFQFFYFDSWISMFNPATWVGGNY